MKKNKIFMIAAEPSGDLIGAKLLKSLNSKIDVEAVGVGGENMISTGFRTLFSIKDFSVLGYLEVLSKIPLIMLRMSQIIKAIRQFKPDILITIDAPSLNFRIVRRLRKIDAFKNLKIIQYVAPTVWAYQPQRAQEVASLYDHIFTILPFEKKYFDAVGIPCTYCGHPVVDDALPQKSKLNIRTEHGYDNCKLVTIALGSRVTEVKIHLPIIMEVMQKFKNKNIYFFIPTLPNLYDFIKKSLESSELMEYCKISTDPTNRRELMYASDAAIIKVGTIAMECSYMRVPVTTFYKVSAVSAMIVKRKVKIKFLSILNFMANQEIVPELIQDKCTVSNLCAVLEQLLSNPADQLSKLEPFLEQLNAGDKPSEIAANAVMRVIREGVKSN